MKYIKRAFYLIAMVFGILIIFIAVTESLGVKANKTVLVNSASIKIIRPGMSLDTVYKILGMPYQVSVGIFIHNISCERSDDYQDVDLPSGAPIKHIIDSVYSIVNYCCPNKTKAMLTRRTKLTYTRPVPFSKYYPMLWVHLGDSDKVASVFAKRYSGMLGFDDPSIYSLSRDSSIFIDESVFNECFK